ncbi:MAG TPA: sugar ABC transporter permease [Jiangellaceae bacterium]
MSTTVPTGRRQGTDRAAGPPAESRRARLGRSYRNMFDNRLLPILLVAPAIVVIGGLIGYPVIRTAWLSFTDADLGSLISGEMSWVGLDNYVDALSDPTLRRAIVATILFGLSCVVGTMLVGIAVALLLNRAFRGRTLLGVLVLLPWAIPHVAASLVWRWIFNDQYGVLNWMLSSLGFSSLDGYSWFNNWLTAFTVIGVVVIWQSFPLVSLVLLAGLQTIPTEVTEAARIDGASAWQRTRLVVLPMLKPLLLVLIVISTIWDFKIFDQIYVLTDGGPARRTEVLAYTAYREAFTQSDYGLGSALAMILFVILIIATLLYVRLIRDEEEVR